MFAMPEANEKKTEHWLTSKEIKAILKVSDCHLMHLRLQGALKFKKVGNSFFYCLDKHSLAGKEV
jgi:hypothetical protein